MDFRFAGHQAEASVHTRAARVFAHRLDALLGNAAHVDVMADITKSGHAAVDLFDMVASGDIEFCYFAASYLAEKVPSLGILDLPFSVHDRGRAMAALDGDVGERLITDIEAATPYRVLGFWDNGFRHFSNAKHPLRSPGDCRGLRMRTLNNQFYCDVLSAIGFEPMITDAKDLIRVVASGEVDGQENPLTNFLNFGLWEYHRHVTFSAHFYGIVLLLCRQEAFADWPAPTQQAVLEAAREATLANRRFAAEDDVICKAELEKNGVAFVNLTEAESQVFQNAVAGLVEAQKATLDGALLDAYLASQINLA